MMYEYSQSCLETFLKKQGQLFDEPVAETLEEAEEFLEDYMAVVVSSLKEVRSYLEESGMDVSSMSLEEIAEIEEVFALDDGLTSSWRLKEAGSNQTEEGRWQKESEKNWLYCLRRQ